jgi:N6-adenosine-specific RNA methylase IME4/ParB-like chromosome segregation protein Spo0J
MGLPFHPLANLFPLIEGAEFDQLVASIRANGLRDPIMVCDGLVIDGRNRQRACEAAEVDCIYQPLASDADPLAFVLDKNLHRRHLNESQRGYIAAKLANMSQGARTDLAPIDATSQDAAADRLHVSRRTVQRGAIVRDKAAPEIQREVERGTLALSAAAQAAAFAPEQQRKIAAEASAGRANVVRTVIKQQAREQREQTLAGKIVSQTVSEQHWPEHQCDTALSVGRAAEHLVCADALMRGWNAFLAGQGSPYDLVLQKGSHMLRVQVKSSQAPRNVNSRGLNERIAYSFAALRRGKDGQGPRLTREDADIMACVAMDIGAIAYLPVTECSSTIQLEAKCISENGYIRTYDGTIREYPLDRAIARIENEHHYIELQKIYPPFPRKRFGVILADPPWSFETWSSAGMDRAADNHYPTLSVDLLCGLGPFIPAADDCVLFLWAIAPMLSHALMVMGAWGFDYKTSFVWKKNKVGTGYWFRNQHETLLLGTRGNIPAPAPGTQWPSVIEADVAEHSTKPERFLQLIEDYFPTLPKIELNRRGPARPGWSAWGNEAIEHGASRVPGAPSEPAPLAAPRGAGSSPSEAA